MLRWNSRQGDKQPGFEDIQLFRMEQLVENALLSRQQFFDRFMDPRRDVDDECGYPKLDGDDFGSESYRQLYEREAVACRVVQVLPRESWQVQPSVYEDDNPEVETPFEKAWNALGQGLRGERSWHQNEQGSPVWEHLRRADIMSGIGHYGILLLGIDDGGRLSDPVEGTIEQSSARNQLVATAPGTDQQYYGVQLSPPEQAVQKPPKVQRKLIFLRAFDESLVQVTQYEADVASPRFGMPKTYRVTLTDPRMQYTGIGLPLATVQIHWTRIIHLADNLGSSEVFGSPRMKAVLNRLLDLRKLYGGSAEMYWRGAFPGLSVETHPQLGGDVVIDEVGMRNMLEQYMNGLQRYLALTGMSARSLAPQVVDPTSQIRVQIEAICVQLGIPLRVFMGSERGELASTQDDAAWNDRLKERQRNYITPRIIVPFVDRLILLGVLPEPVGYSIHWPDLTSQTTQEKSQVAFQRTQALAQYVSSGAEEVMQPLDYLIRILGMDEAEAMAVMDNTTKAKEAADAQAKQDALDNPSPQPDANPNAVPTAVEQGDGDVPGDPIAQDVDNLPAVKASSKVVPPVASA